MPQDLPSGINPRGDRRSRRFVLAVECIFNQNARINGAAAWPAMNLELVRICERHGAGIVQIRCPEMHCLGWARKTAPGVWLREAMEREPALGKLHELAASVAEQTQDYLANGYRPMAVLGANPRSPGCAVHHEGDGLAANSGVFILCLAEEFRRRGLEIPFRGIRDCDPKLMTEDLEWLEALLTKEQK
ncbi:MAG TPA: hypothetical protein PK280_03800 [Planctomycetota bacterium]|nr:hypothetical protein [Planctomycetota bacterium]